MILTCYRFDRKYWAYTGQERVRPLVAQPYRLIYELPAYATLVEPPETQEHEAAVFLDRTQHWVIVSDHRGETWFDWAGRPQVIDRLGDPAQWGMKREERKAS